MERRFPKELRVWVNGTFDVLHRGHIELLEYASKFGKVRVGIDTETAELKTEVLVQGDSVRQLPGQPHQLECLKQGTIYEVSTTHFDSDSYRVWKGDSQP